MIKIIINISIQKNNKIKEKNKLRKKHKIKKLRKKIVKKKIKEEKLKNKKRNRNNFELNNYLEKNNNLKIKKENEWINNKNNFNKKEKVKNKFKIINLINNIFYKKIKQKNINEENKLILNDGIFSEIDFISPSYINLNNPKFIEIDEMFYSTLLCVNYFREQSDLILKTLIDSNINLNISIFYEKQDTYKTIKELTYHIGNIGVELKENDSNRQDMDIAAFSYNDAKYIRKEMQLNNEEMYYMYIYLTVFARDKKELEYLLNKVEGLAESKGIRNKTSIF